MTLTLSTSATAILPGQTGALRYYTLSNPATGADWTFTVPAGESWVVQMIAAVLIASATVASRVPNLAPGPSTGAIAVLPQPTAVTAGQTIGMAWGVGLSAVTNGIRMSTSAPMVTIPPNGVVQSLTDNLQSGDRWIGIGIAVLAYT